MVNMNRRSVDEIMKGAIISEVETFLVMCKPEQLTRFRVIFPLWPEVSLESAKHALDIVYRTIDINIAKGA